MWDQRYGQQLPNQAPYQQSYRQPYQQQPYQQQPYQQQPYQQQPYQQQPYQQPSRQSRQPLTNVSKKGSKYEDPDESCGKGSDKKKKKKLYTDTFETQPPIYKDVNVEEYRNFIINILTTRGKLTDKMAREYTSNMTSYILAITHDSVNTFKKDPSSKQENDNYELLEHFGDATINKCATWYLKNRFPDVITMGNRGVNIFSKQKCLLVSKPYLARLCTEIGLVNFIRYRPLKYEYGEYDKERKQTVYLVKNITVDQTMTEDIFEAFIAALEETIDNMENMIGIGYSVAYNIISSLYDEKEIAHDVSDLTDPKSILKEYIDKLKKTRQDTTTYTMDPLTKEVTLVVHLESSPDDPENKTPLDLVFKHTDRTKVKKLLEKIVSKQALDYINKTYPGFFKVK
jgi:dsRNA-specific ribonuclease